MANRQQARRQPAPHKPTSATPNKGAERPSSVSGGSQTTKPASSAAEPVPAVVVFGTDATGKPRAAYFEEAQADLATKAAALMNLRVVSVSGPNGQALARQLPAGKIYESGRGFVPFIRRDLYERLFASASQSDPAAAAKGGEPSNAAQVNGNENKTGTQAGLPPPSPPRLPRNWDEIGVGSLVLATIEAGDGWWEAVVERVDGPQLTLKWRDFPKEPRFVMRREQLALLHPGDK